MAAQTFIKISELITLPTISVSSDDYFPLVDSGSTTTFRVPISSLNSYLEASGSSLSSSYAENARSSSYSLYSSNALSASYSLSASHANNADNAISASYVDVNVTVAEAIHAKTADSASYTIYSPNNGRIGLADFSITSGTSYACNGTSSYAKTSSIAMSSSVANTLNNMAGVAKAWGQFTSSAAGVYPIGTYYNVSSISRVSDGIFLINFSPALPSTNYIVIGGGVQLTPSSGKSLISMRGYEVVSNFVKEVFRFSSKNPVNTSRK